MSESVTFTVPLPPTALSPNSRAHWRAKNAAKQAYAEAVWIAGSDACFVACFTPHEDVAAHHSSDRHPPWKWAAVHLIKHSTHQTDQDNVIASCKVLIDCLSTKGTRPLAIFEDDKRIAVTAEWKRERVRAKGRIEVVITRREDPNEHEWCHPEFHRCDGGGPGAAMRYEDRR